MLQAAATGNSASVVTFLLDRGDGIELADDIFKAAAGNGDETVLQVLSKHCGLPKVSEKRLDIARLHNILDSNSLEKIGSDRHLDVVKELIGRGVEPDVLDMHGGTPLVHVVVSGDILTVQALLSAGANPNSTTKNGLTPLHHAASRGHFAIVEILLDLGVPTHLQDRNSRTSALEVKNFGHIKVFRLLERRRQP